MWNICSIVSHFNTAWYRQCTRTGTSKILRKYTGIIIYILNTVVFLKNRYLYRIE